MPTTTRITRADMVARREARATEAWLAANPPRIVEVSQDDGGFDLLSAGIGPAVVGSACLLLLAVSMQGSVLRARVQE